MPNVKKNLKRQQFSINPRDLIPPNSALFTEMCSRSFLKAQSGCEPECRPPIYHFKVFKIQNILNPYQFYSNKIS